MAIRVFDEISPLQKVLVHRPGAELEQLTPLHLNRMLFDDIPYLQGAQKEHDFFVKALREEGVEVLYLVDLVAQSLHSEDIRLAFIQDLVAEGGGAARYEQQALSAYLHSIKDPKALVEKAMAGVDYEEAGIYRHHPLTQLVRHETHFLLDPLPNLYFTRDPFSTIGRGVAFSSMFARIRQREGIFGRYIFSHHPDFAKEVPAWYDKTIPYSLEGGDILNLGNGVLGVGLSQRTSAEGIEQLCRNLSRDEGSGITSILAFDIPNVRAFMHLDTVFTQVDQGTFVFHPGILPSLRLYHLCMVDGALKAEEKHGSLEQVLGEVLDVPKVSLIRCGGADRVASEREQWNDGSNTLCVRPGSVVVYDRTAVTNRILQDQGIHTIEIPGSELGRGRGGPRCMSMPLQRGYPDAKG